MEPETKEDLKLKKEFDFYETQMPSRVYVHAVIGLVVISILSIASVVAIIIFAKEGSNYDGLLTLGSASVGGLVGIFSQQNNNNNNSN